MKNDLIYTDIDINSENLFEQLKMRMSTRLHIATKTSKYCRLYLDVPHDKLDEVKEFAVKTISEMFPNRECIVVTYSVLGIIEINIRMGGNTNDTRKGKRHNKQTK